MIDETILAYQWAYYRANLKPSPDVTYSHGWFQVWHGATHYAYRAREFETLARRLDRRASRAGRPVSWNRGQYPT